MIKKDFEDDIKKTKGLLKMISNLYKTNYEGLTGKQLMNLEYKKRRDNSPKRQRIRTKKPTIQTTNRTIKATIQKRIRTKKTKKLKN